MRKKNDQVKLCNQCGKQLNGCAVWQEQIVYFCVNLDCAKYALYQFPINEMQKLKGKEYKSV